MEGEIRCGRYNRRDFASAESLKRHCKRVHQKPAIAGTLAFKLAQKRLKEEAHAGLPQLSVGDTDYTNVFSRKWIGSWMQADGEQEELVSTQLNMLSFYYSGLRGLLCDGSMLLQWRLQWYVSGVVAPALHNVGCWLLDGKTKRRMNGANSRLLARITQRSVHQEARSPTFDIVQWAKWKRARWLGHIMREPELSLVREAVFEEAERGRSGTLLDDAPPFRSRQHLRALASKEDNTWEEWCKGLKSAVRPANEALKRARGGQKDSAALSVVVPPPVCLRGDVAVDVGKDPTGESVGDIVARVMEEMEGRPVLDATAPTDLYTDGSCLDPGKPWAAAGWGVHVVNSDKLGDYYGALPGSIQTNSRAELVALEAALQLAWLSPHQFFRIFTDCEYAKKGIRLWLDKWRLNGWVNASGSRVSHTDVWRKIAGWMDKFKAVEDVGVGSMRILHVKAHSGIAGNERADKWAGMGSKLRYDTMVKSQPGGWFRNTVERYWSNRI